jgi:hypothetical protein
VERYHGEHHANRRSLSLSRPQKKPRVDPDAEKLVVEITNASGRNATFEKRIMQRDQHCISLDNTSH